MLIFLFVMFVVWLARRAGVQTGGARPESGNALDIARERYARGEISKAEFDEIKGNLA